MPSNTGTNRAGGGPLHGAARALRPAKSPLPHPSPPLQRAARPSMCITAGPAPHFAAVLGGSRAVNSLICVNSISRAHGTKLQVAITCLIGGIIIMCGGIIGGIIIMCGSGGFLSCSARATAQKSTALASMRKMCVQGRWERSMEERWQEAASLCAAGQGIPHAWRGLGRTCFSSTGASSHPASCWAFSASVRPACPKMHKYESWDMKWCCTGLQQQAGAPLQRTAQQTHLPPRSSRRL